MEYISISTSPTTNVLSPEELEILVVELLILSMLPPSLLKVCLDTNWMLEPESLQAKAAVIDLAEALKMNSVLSISGGLLLQYLSDIKEGSPALLERDTLPSLMASFFMLDFKYSTR